MIGENGERNRLIGLARRALGPDGDDRDRLRALAGDLFAHVGLEDLGVYGGPDLAAFVRSADALLARRKPGETVISLDDPAAGTATPGAEVTVLGILNENMPFLSIRRWPSSTPSGLPSASSPIRSSA
jgi:NAD-specific glutamate dehydrogenase